MINLSVLPWGPGNITISVIATHDPYGIDKAGLQRLQHCKIVAAPCSRLMVEGLADFIQDGCNIAPVNRLKASSTRAASLADLVVVGCCQSGQSLRGPLASCRPQAALVGSSTCQQTPPTATQARHVPAKIAHVVCLPQQRTQGPRQLSA